MKEKVMAGYDMVNILKDAQYGEPRWKNERWREENPE